jgi:hypothetical protein
VTKRRGVLTVAEKLTTRAGLALPVGHRIVAERPDADARCVEWLIEGPMMPEMPPSGEAAEVELLLTMHYEEGEFGEDGPPCRITAVWRHRPDESWLVKAWPSCAAFKAEWIE